MYHSEIVGQDKLKSKLQEIISNGQSPHCQVFVDPSGYGGLPLALSSALGLIYGFELLNNEERKGVSSNKLIKSSSCPIFFASSIKVSLTDALHDSLVL